MIKHTKLFINLIMATGEDQGQPGNYYFHSLECTVQYVICTVVQKSFQQRKRGPKKKTNEKFELLSS